MQFLQPILPIFQALRNLRGSLASQYGREKNDYSAECDGEKAEKPLISAAIGQRGEKALVFVDEVPSAGSFKNLLKVQIIQQYPRRKSSGQGQKTRCACLKVVYKWRQLPRGAWGTRVFVAHAFMFQ